MSTAREFIQKPSTFRPERDRVSGWFACRIPQGIHCLWDGGITAGVPLRVVPWAGTESPNGTVKYDLPPHSSGLWDEHAEPVTLPPSFLQRMPPFMCQGVVKYTPQGIEFSALAAPTVEQFFRDGIVRTEKTHVNIVFDNIMQWIRDNELHTIAPPADSTFSQELFAMSAWDGWSEDIYIEQQKILSLKYEQSCLQVQALLEDRKSTVMFRHPDSVWAPYRVDECLSFKLWEGYIDD